MVVGETHFVGTQMYVVVNGHGTLEKLHPMPWYRKLLLAIRNGFKDMTVSEVKDYNFRHRK